VTGYIQARAISLQTNVSDSRVPPVWKGPLTSTLLQLSSAATVSSQNSLLTQSKNWDFFLGDVVQRSSSYRPLVRVRCLTTQAGRRQMTEQSWRGAQVQNLWKKPNGTSVYYYVPQTQASAPTSHPARRHGVTVSYGRVMLRCCCCCCCCCCCSCCCCCCWLLKQTRTMVDKSYFDHFTMYSTA
jgi:hypothetical protein